MQINNKSVVWYNQKNMTGGIAQTLKNNSDEWRNPHIDSDKKIVQLLCSSSWTPKSASSSVCQVIDSGDYLPDSF